MHRWLIVLLLTLVQFQLAWGAVAPYCGHESNAAASGQHFGHHEHKHPTDRGSADEANQADGVFGNHPDCESCHLGSSGTLPTMPRITHFEAPRDVYRHLEHPFSSHVPPGPERPDRNPSPHAA